MNLPPQQASGAALAHSNYLVTSSVAFFMATRVLVVDRPSLHYMQTSRGEYAVRNDNSNLIGSVSIPADGTKTPHMLLDVYFPLRLPVSFTQELHSWKKIRPACETHRACAMNVDLGTGATAPEAH